VLVLSQVPSSFAGATDPSITGTGLTGTCNDKSNCSVSVSIPENSTWTGTYDSNMNTNWSIPTSGGDSEKDYGFFSLSEAGPSTSVTVTLSARDFENKLDDGANNTYMVGVVALKAGGAGGDKSVLTITITITDVDDTAPTITGSNSLTVVENSSSATILQDYNANETVTWTLEGVDASLFTISATGELKLVSSPNYEDKSSYAITVAATDSASNKSTLAVAVNVTDVDEVAPVILCDSSDCGGFLSIDVPENATGGVVYSFDSDEPVTWTIENCTAETCASGDKNLFSINASGDLSINAIEFDPTPGEGEGNDNSYTVVIVATDSLSNSTTLEFNVNVTDVDTVAPTITGTSSISVSEDVDITTVLATYSANEAVTWALEGADAAFFSINASGELLFAAAPDYETKSSYSVTITATDVASNSSSSEVLITILDVTEAGGGGNDGDQTPSEDAKKIIEAKLIREVTDAHSNLKNSLVNSMAQSGIKAMVNPQDLIYLAVPGLNSENVVLIHKSFSASKLADSVDAFIAYAKKYSIVSRLATVGLTKGVTLKELQVLGLVDSNSSADASLLRALRAVPVSDRDTVEELEEVIASLLASR